jgi:hypothetical protein
LTWSHPGRRFYEFAQADPAPIVDEALQRADSLIRRSRAWRQRMRRPHRGGHEKELASSRRTLFLKRRFKNNVRAP